MHPALYELNEKSFSDHEVQTTIHKHGEAIPYFM